MVRVGLVAETGKGAISFEALVGYEDRNANTLPQISFSGSLDDSRYRAKDTAHPGDAPGHRVNRVCVNARKIPRYS